MLDNLGLQRLGMYNIIPKNKSYGSGITYAGIHSVVSKAKLLRRCVLADDYLSQRIRPPRSGRSGD